MTKRSEKKQTILLAGGNGVGKTSLKKSIRKAMNVCILDTDDDGDEDERSQYETLLKSADIVVIAVSTFVTNEDIWLIKKATRESKPCCLVRPKANVLTETWSNRIFSKQWDELDTSQREVIVKIVRYTHQDDKERIRSDISADDVPIFLVNCRTLATSQDLPADYDAGKLLNFFKK